MSNEYAPNGVSFIQIKKDAKKLKKEKEITYLEALDIATRNKTNFPNWKSLEKTIKDFGGTAAKINFYNNNIVLYKKANLMGVYTAAGRGKSLMLIDTINRNKDKFKKIGFVNLEHNIETLKKRLPNNVVIINSLDYIENDMDLIVVDLLSITMNRETSQSYKKLLELDVPVLYGMPLSRNNSTSKKDFFNIQFVSSIYSDLLLDTPVIIHEDEEGDTSIDLIYNTGKEENFIRKQNITILNKLNK